MITMYKPMRSKMVDRFNLLSRGLIGVWTFNELTGNTVFDYTENKSNAQFIDQPSWITTNTGAALRFNGVSDALQIQSSTIKLPQSSISILVRVRLSSLNQSRVIWSAENSVSNRNSLIYIDNANKFHVSIGNNISSTDLVFSDVETTNQWIDIGFSWSAVDNTLRGFRDGKQQLNTNLFTSSLSTNISHIGIGARLFDSTMHLSGDVAFTYLWNRQLTNDDFRLLHSNPYEIFEAQTWFYALISDQYSYLDKQDSEIESDGFKIGVSSIILDKVDSEIDVTSIKISSGFCHLLYPGSLIICSGGKFSSGQGTLIYQGSEIKGWDPDSEHIKTLIPIYLWKDEQPYDPCSVYYTICDPTGNLVKGQIDREASRAESGHYYANYNWPALIPGIIAGEYKIIWEVYETCDGQAITKADSFIVYKDKPQTCVARHGPTASDGGTQQSGTGNTPIYPGTKCCCPLVVPTGV